MSLYALPPLIATVINIAIGIFVYSRKKDEISKRFFFMSLCVGVWMFDLFGLMIAPTENFALIWSRIFQTGMFYIAPTLFHFILKICNNTNRLNKRLLVIAYLFASVTFLSWLDHFRPIFIKYSWGYWPLGFEPIYFTLFVYSVSCLLYGLFLLFKKVKNSYALEEKTRFVYLFISVSFGVISGFFSFLPTFGIGVYPFGPIGQFLYLSIMAYLIIKYRFMNFKWNSSVLFLLTCRKSSKSRKR